MSAPRAVVCAYSLVGDACLEAVLDVGWEVALVATHADDPNEHRWFPSVAERAAAAGVPITTAEPDDPELARRVEEARPDFLLSFYYRRMLPVAILELAQRGAFNLHGSLLPAYRGRASIHWQILRGERETGVTLHRMVAKADAGAIVAQKAIPIGPDETALELTRRVARAAAELVRETLPRLADGTADERPMDLAAGSYFGGRKPADGRIDWTGSARAAHDLVRAVTHPFPGAFAEAAGRKLYVWTTRVAAEAGQAGRPGEILSRDPFRVACGRGTLEVVSAQLEGGDERPAAELPIEEGDLR